MPYRMITHVANLSGRLGGAATRHAERIVSSLTRRWRGRLAEGEELTVTRLLSLLAEDLEDIHNRLTAGENHLRSELHEDKRERGVRNRAASDVRELLFDVKKMCDAHYGPGSVQNLFEEDSEDVPTEHSEVFRLGSRVRDHMRDPDFPMPPLKHGIAPDFAGLANRLDEPLELLGTSLQGLHHGTHGSSGAVADKERDLDQFQVFAGRAGRFLEAITFLAGEDGVARRIRLSRRRRAGGSEELDEPDALDEPDEADPPSDDEAPDSGADAVPDDKPPEEASA